MKRHPASELPPNNGRYQVSDGEKVYIASCLTYSLDGKPKGPPIWIREGDHSGTRPMIWWSRPPRARARPAAAG